jgi:acyl dehydratase
MSERITISQALLQSIAHSGSHYPLLTSAWQLIDQASVNQFGQLTRDPDRMHIDPEWAREHSPYGHTISFGFFTMALLSGFSHEMMQFPSDGYAINYGFDKVRMLAPVPVESRIRAHGMITQVTRKDALRYLCTTNMTVEIEHHAKPGLVADWLFMFVFDGSMQRTAEFE